MKKNKIIFGFCFLIFISSLAILILNKFEIVINYSESLPYKFVVIDKEKKPKNKGDITVFYVFDSKQLGVKKIKFIKIFGGSTGSYILVKDNKIFIDNSFIGTIKEYSKNNQKLNPISSQIISTQKYFFYSPHPDSFDSRYQEIGLIDEKNIVGTAIFAY